MLYCDTQFVAFLYRFKVSMESTGHVLLYNLFLYTTHSAANHKYQWVKNSQQINLANNNSFGNAIQMRISLLWLIRLDRAYTKLTQGQMEPNIRTLIKLRKKFYFWCRETLVAIFNQLSYCWPSLWFLVMANIMFKLMVGPKIVVFSFHDKFLPWIVEPW